MLFKTQCLQHLRDVSLLP